MTDSLFRKQALERLSRRDGLDQALRVTNPIGWLVMTTMLLFIAFCIYWSVITKVPVKVLGQGILLNAGGVVEVISSSEGRLLKLLVSPGDYVTDAQLVAMIDQPDIQLELDLKRAELAGEKAHLIAINAFHDRDDLARQANNKERSAALAKQIRLLSQRLKWQRDLDKVLEGLWKKKLVNREKLLQNRIQISQIKETLAEVETQSTSLLLEERETEIEYERETLDIENKIATLERETAGIEQRLERHSGVLSPYAGLMVESKVNEGEFVNIGLSLLSLLREDDIDAKGELSAVVYVPPSDGKKVKPGMEVDVVMSTVKREEFGFIRGRVIRVAEVPSTSQGMLRTLKNDRLVESLSGEQGAPFEVHVELLTDAKSLTGYAWSSGLGPDTHVHSGTLVDVDISVRHVRLITLIFPAIEQWLDQTNAVIKEAR